MEASVEVPIPVPNWILDNFHGMLQDPTDRYMQMTLYRYHPGNSISVEQLEDRLFSIVCFPHFSLMPYINDFSENTIDYNRFGFVKDDGLQP